MFPCSLQIYLRKSSTLFAIPSSVSATLSCIYSFTLSFHLRTGLSLFLVPKISYIHFIHKLFTILPLDMIKTPQFVFFHPFHFHPCTLLLFHKISCHIFHTLFHCSHPFILSCHILLSGNSFSQHALLTAMPCSLSLLILKYQKVQLLIFFEGSLLIT